MSNYLQLSKSMYSILNPKNLGVSPENTDVVEGTKILLKLSDDEVASLLTAARHYASISEATEECQEEITLAFMMGFFLARYEKIQQGIDNFLNSTFGPGDMND